MTAKPQSPAHPDAVPDVPHLGLIRPPLVYLTSLVMGALLQFAMPLPFFPQTLNVALGASLVVLAMALVSYSVAKFRAAGTPVPAREPVIGREEHYLEQKFGAGYLDYKASVRRWL